MRTAGKKPYPIDLQTFQKFYNFHQKTVNQSNKMVLFSFLFENQKITKLLMLK